MLVPIIILFVVGLMLTILILIQYQPNTDMAVAVFKGEGDVVGETTFRDERGGCRIVATFTALPPGLHGFHIHEAGDLRGEGCKAACAHYHKGGATSHGGEPGTSGQRHTGDLGNIRGPTFRRSYFLSGVRCSDLWGRSLIVHADEDDLGRGGHEDSATTGNSGARIACVLIGRVAPCHAPKKTRKHK
jgi:Cu-Zn family superoxide dismutase